MEDYERFASLLAEIRSLRSVSQLLAWDQETCMPAPGALVRAEQIALVAALIHERSTSEALGEVLDRLEAAPAGLPGEEARWNVVRARYFYDRARRVPRELVQRKASAATIAKSAWREARAASDFEAFRPHMEELVAIHREIAQAAEPQGHLYDGLLEEYEPGMTTRTLDPIFATLARRLGSLLVSIESGRPVRSFRPPEPVDASLQERFAADVLRATGFDLEAGRLDRSTHPFCTRLGSGDVRLTARYRESDWTAGLFSVLHEGGHGLYNQGLDSSQAGLPLGEPVSLGIHESQSLYWENIIGRSRAFWAWLAPKARASLTGHSSWDADDFYGCVNRVSRSLIRVEADEVTYTLHVIFRYELEKALISGDLAVRDLPSAWNDKMAHTLGIRPERDAEGVLQDIHWASGYLGYFPTYALGNLYSAQFDRKMREDVDGLDTRIARGEFGSVLEWLRRQIHCRGQRYFAGELVEVVTGEPFGPEPFLTYLEAKYGELYR